GVVESMMRVERRGTRRVKFSSRRLKGIERAHNRWRCEKISSPRTFTSASSAPSSSMALRVWGSTVRMKSFVRCCRSTSSWPRSQPSLRRLRKLACAAIHVFLSRQGKQDVDARRKAGHDGMWGGLCCLLRRHLVHLARLKVDADAVDLVEVGPGHAHEACAVGIV